MDNKEEILKSLRALKCIVNEILEEANKDEIDGAINWADLACTSARYVVQDTGEILLSVIIEEASPDAWDLQNYVDNKLIARGWNNVEVMTEW